MTIFALILMAVAFIVIAANLREEWIFYWDYSFRDHEAKATWLLHSVGYSGILLVLGWAIYQIMFGGLYD